MKKMKLFVMPVFILLATQFSLAQNPFVRDIFTADPSAHVWADGRLYVYPSHDMNPPRGCDLMDKYHVYSTDDMVNWVDHGQIVEASQVPWQKEALENGGKFMWAPDCAYRDGKYYFYFPHPDKNPWNSSWKIGIAVSDKPASDFTILPETLKGLPESGEIDPCVFIDDDGQAYFYYGGGGNCYGSKLKDNMIELDGALQPMTGLYNFHEGTWVFKKDGVYYLTYADGNSGGNQLRYATSNNPLGPWSHKGVYLTPTTSDTSHGSVVEYKGQWWAFYHTADLSGTGLLRSICVDSLFFNENGTIKTVVQTKDAGKPYQNIQRSVPGTVEAEDFNDGGQGIAYWDNTSINSYRVYRPNESVDINQSRRWGVIYVTDTENKEYLNYTLDVSTAGTYDIHFIIGAVSSTADIKFYLEFDGKKTSNPRRYSVPFAEIPDLTTVTVPNIQLSAGKHTLTFYPSGNVTFDKFTFVLQGAGIPTPAAKPLAVYPNPASNVIYCDSPASGAVTITDLSGRKVYSGNRDYSQQSIDISGVASGVYLITLQTEKALFLGKILVKK
ncbi:hypothetical protein FACS1894145_2870 [Bacteroidia bacterium]|nr:hypothetical protein FACS1894145_2870 [Bacteroidia bacterium]